MNIEEQQNSWNPGVFIDIDGVVLQGGKPFEWSKEAIYAMWNNKVPFVFVTNGTYSAVELVDNLRKIFDLPFTNDHVIVAPSPCAGLNEFHNKRVLVCCQEDSVALVNELGFSDFITIDQLSNIFPELDYIDHNRRKQLLAQPVTPEQLQAQRDFRPIELILLLGEPINWECSLQLLIDVIMTGGDPRKKFKFIPEPHLPIIACNKDLTFKGAAVLPRFGHGAFLECLEAIYMKITKNQLCYEEIMGKPYLIQYEYAAKQIQKLSPNGKEINKFYIIGDNPEVDIKGANTFREHLENTSSNKLRRPSRRQSLVARLNTGYQSHLSSQPVESILVCTGVYNPQNDLLYHVRKLIQRQTSSNKCVYSPPNDRNNNFLSGSAPASADNLKKAGVQVSLSPFVDDNGEKTLQRNHSFNSYSFINDSPKLDDVSDLNDAELSQAMARRNSFISYFDDEENVPDHTFDNLKVSVDYILDSIGIMN